MARKAQPLALFLLVALAACRIETHGLAPDTFLTITPAVVCPSEPVEICWNLRLPRNQELCDCPQGFRDGSGPTPCVASADCPSGSSCLDGFCCAGGCSKCGGNLGCNPDFTMTIHTDPATPLDPPVEDYTARQQSCTTMVPDRTTTLSLEGGFQPPPTRLAEEEHTVTVIDARPVGAFPVSFPFVCPGWAPFDVSTLGSVSPNVAVTGVRNTSAHMIDLTGPTVVPGSSDPGSAVVVLRPGEITAVFNGPFRGRWQAALNPAATAGLPTPRCTPTAITDPFPGLQIELIMECSVDPGR